MTLGDSRLHPGLCHRADTDYSVSAHMDNRVSALFTEIIAHGLFGVINSLHGKDPSEACRFYQISGESTKFRTSMISNVWF